jgi:hypothetical protein
MTTADLIHAWLPWFILGLAVETPIFAMVGKVLTRDNPQGASSQGASSQGASWRRLLLAGAIGTCITHPLFVFVWPHFVHSYLVWAISGEIIVTVVETFTFWLVARPISLPRAAVCSLAANTASLVIGLVLQWLSATG